MERRGIDISRLLLVTLLAAAPTAVVPSQTYNWVRSPVNGHEYALTAPMTWSQAESAAQAVGAHLVTIRNSSERAWILQRYPVPSQLWIGINDAAVEGVWQWTSGATVSFTDWCPGEPSNGADEDYGRLGGAGARCWRDVAGTANWPGLIERPILASYTSYRASCPSSVGIPRLSATPPVAGRVWALTVDNLRANTAGYLFFSLDDQRWGVNRLPVNLASIGAPGCFMNVNTEPRAGTVVHAVPSDPQGVVTVQFGIPNAVAVLGFEFFNQYLSLDAPAGRPLRITTTNAGRGVVGR